MTAACVTLLEAKQLNLGLNAVDEAHLGKSVVGAVVLREILSVAVELS